MSTIYEAGFYRSTKTLWRAAILPQASFTKHAYNGNIAGTIWKSEGDKEKRKYDFDYDAANRLLKADFTQQNGTAWNTGAGIDYSMKMGNGTNAQTAYDANGNLLKMWQKGWKFGGSTPIDDMTCGYDAGNRVDAVSESAATLADQKLGDFTDKHQGSGDYTYDVNGNMTADLNKGITSIDDNHLNLPSTITVKNDNCMGDKGTIRYIYDAAGNKLEKRVHDSSHDLI